MESFVSFQYTQACWVISLALLPLSIQGEQYVVFKNYKVKIYRVTIFKPTENIVIVNLTLSVKKYLPYLKHKA